MIAGLVVHFSNYYYERQMKAKDKRTRLTTEIVENIKYIKLYAWSDAYLEKLRDVRNNDELRNMTIERILDGSFNIIWALPRYLVAGLTFITFVLTQSRPLTSDLIFPALSLFNLLNFPVGLNNDISILTNPW